MGDFPYDGNSQAIAAWLASKGFNDVFIGWDAHALLGLERIVFLEEAVNIPDKNRLWCLLNFVQTKAPATVAVIVTAQVKMCDIEFESRIYKVGFKADDDLRVKITSNLRAAKVKIPKDRDLERYHVLDNKDVIITGFGELVAGQKYAFALPRIFLPVPANKWTSEHVNDLLKIQFINDYDFIGNHSLSEEGQLVLNELQDVNGTLLHAYKTKHMSLTELTTFRANNEGLRSSLKKSMFAAEKFANNEATVDSFLNLLLYRLGFFEEWLLPIPQYPFQFEFSNSTKDAICDFCIVDVVSFALMAISEDKSVDNERMNSEGQLFAEIIAAVMQLIGKKKRKSPDDEVVLSDTERTLFGLRLNGLIFHFYQVTVSNAMLEAVRTGRPTNTSTQVTCRRYLDFRNKEDREVIIRTLDTWRDAMTDAGGRSERLPSYGKNAGESS